MKKTTPIDLKAERAELAAQQELLLESLLAQGEPPVAIDRKQIMATASSLFRKRARYIYRDVFPTSQTMRSILTR